jgi:selenocysteine-specific elongation factor
VRVVATAGHVDHGKSSLVMTLTGTDPDRFPEEKARGLTIDLGFAFTTLGSGQVVGFVDVPGHVRFVKNMLAGVGAVDVAMLVVAANEGWMPQTEEHVQILRLLDIEHGVIALTKTDVVDAEQLELARLDLEEHIAGTTLEAWPVVTTDALSGRGIDALRTTLDDVIAAAPAPRDNGRPRLWIDRVFSAKGAGTVVTGTLTGGSLAVDDDVVIEPGHRRARVRGIEAHHERLALVAPGSRVALNLTGVGRDDMARGDAVVRSGHWHVVGVVDVALHAATGSDFPKHGSVHVHVGSGERDGRMRVLDDGRRFARVWLDRGVPLAPGDRLVLRSSARQETIGGAEVLDVMPAARAADAVRRLQLPLGARVMAARPWCRSAELAPLAGVGDPDLFVAQLLREGHAVRCGEWLVATAELERVRARASEMVSAGSVIGVDLARVAAACGIEVGRLRPALEGEPTLVVEHDVVRDASTAAVTHDPGAQRLLGALSSNPFAPESPRELGADQALVRALLRSGELVDVDGVIFTKKALDDARALIARAVLEEGSLSVAAIRDLLGTTRKYVIPIVTRMDAEGVTRRRGDERIPGPRANVS